MTAAAPSSAPSAPAWATSTTPETLSFTQIAELVTQAGGTSYDALVGAGIAKGVESGGNTQELAGGVGPAQGLWQFEPTTWAAYAPTGSPPTAGGATPLQQAETFVNAVHADNGFAPWAPDLLAGQGAPGSPTWGQDPAAPLPTSPVGQYLAGHGVTLPPATISGQPATTTSWVTYLSPVAGGRRVVGGAVSGAAGAAASSVWHSVEPFLATAIFVIGGGVLIILGAKGIAAPGARVGHDAGAIANLGAVAA